MLTDQLIAAYSVTDFVLFDTGEGEIAVNVGRPSAGFDRVLASRGVETAVIVTAYNPRSNVLPDAANRLRHQQLISMLEARGYAYGLGEGRDPTGHWQAELECVVFRISREAGLDLARAFDQNAIVFIRRGAAPELAYPELS